MTTTDELIAARAENPAAWEDEDAWDEGAGYELDVDVAEIQRQYPDGVVTGILAEGRRKYPDIFRSDKEMRDMRRYWENEPALDKALEPYRSLTEVSYELTPDQMKELGPLVPWGFKAAWQRAIQDDKQCLLWCGDPIRVLR